MRYNPNTPTFLQCCEKCGMPRPECVCVLRLNVNPSKYDKNEVMSNLLRKKDCQEWEHIIDDYANFITDDKEGPDHVREMYFGILKWLSENYYPPIKIKK